VRGAPPRRGEWAWRSCDPHRSSGTHAPNWT
jgi:hypothetical protein